MRNVRNLAAVLFASLVCVWSGLGADASSTSCVQEMKLAIYQDTSMDCSDDLESLGNAACEFCFGSKAKADDIQHCIDDYSAAFYCGIIDTVH